MPSPKKKPKRGRLGFQNPLAEARTAPVVHWRCDLCETVKVAPREDGRPAGWIDVKVFGFGEANYLTRCCPGCTPKAALFTLEGCRVQTPEAALREEARRKVEEAKANAHANGTA